MTYFIFGKFKVILFKEGGKLFNIGDKVVYPMQGAGVIEAIEEREFSGEAQKYYVIRIAHNRLTIMIPECKIADSHLRLVNDEDTLKFILQNVHGHSCPMQNFSSMKERNEYLNSKIKSGSLKENAEVVIELMEINSNKRLNSTEKQLLDKAKKLIIGEISLIKGISPNQATVLLNSSMN